MGYELITAEMLYEGLFQELKVVFDICYPIALPMIIGAFFIAAIKRLVRSCTYNFALVSGSTKREAKKKAKRAGDIVDAVSAINDISSLNKKE